MGPEYAVATDWVNDGTAKSPRMRATRWRILPAGHALMGEAMAYNGSLPRQTSEEIFDEIRSRKEQT
jgi:hypothetical protein